MKNLNYYCGDCFDFYKDVVASKRNPRSDPDFLSRVKILDDLIHECYQKYDEKFANNSLENLKEALLTMTVRDDLTKLYNYKNSVLQKLLIDLTSATGRRIFNTCQNCTINEVDSFDHYLSQSQFVEFNVNPKNLVPCCTACNRKKSAKWTENGNRIFLNLYLDHLPELQYLFVTIHGSDDVLDVNYHLEKPDRMDSNFYRLIESHYMNLDLLRRFKINSDKIISNLATDISSFTGKLSYKDICDSIAVRAENNRRILGYNYWVSILELALIESKEFREQVF